jgi:hypothetical protein
MCLARRMAAACPFFEHRRVTLRRTGRVYVARALSVRAGAIREGGRTVPVSPARTVTLHCCAGENECDPIRIVYDLSRGMLLRPLTTRES